MWTFIPKSSQRFNPLAADSIVRIKLRFFFHLLILLAFFVIPLYILAERGENMGIERHNYFARYIREGSSHSLVLIMQWLLSIKPEPGNSLLT